MNDIFYNAVYFLDWMACLLDVSYEFMNVMVFGVLWPLITLALIIRVWVLKDRVRRLEKVLGVLSEYTPGDEYR